jgi:hypothetical protein
MLHTDWFLIPVRCLVFGWCITFGCAIKFQVSIFGALLEPSNYTFADFFEIREEVIQGYDFVLLSGTVR